MKKIILAGMLSCLMAAQCFALSLNEAQGLAYDATCRVNVSDARGTGVVLGYDDSVGKYLVLTNYHVVTNNNSAICDFWINGRLVSCKADVIWRFFNASMPADFCILGIDKDFVDRNKINHVPLAGNEDIDLKDAFFVSAGCPKGIHTGAWKGVVTKTDKSVEFKPAPYPGQSGSGIFKIIDDELWYVGTLTWLVGKEGGASSRGAFIPVANLYQALNVKKMPASYKDDQGPWVAPPDYTECADEQDYRVIEITTANCPACTKALNDVNKLLDKGIDVSSIDFSDCDEAMVQKYKADKFPTFALIDKDGAVVDVWYGYGCFDKIIKTIDDKKSELTYQDFVLEENKEFEPPVINDDLIEEEVVVEDFRNRPSVEEEYTDVNFIDDSEARWNNRNRKSDVKPQEVKPKVQQESKKQDSSNTGMIATRIGNEIEQRLDKAGDQFVIKSDKLFDKAGDKLIKKVDVVFDKKKDSLKAEIKQIIKESSCKIFWYFVLAIIVSCVCVQALAFFVKKCVVRFFKFLFKIVSNGLKQIEIKDEK